MGLCCKRTSFKENHSVWYYECRRTSLSFHIHALIPGSNILMTWHVKFMALSLYDASLAVYSTRSVHVWGNGAANSGWREPEAHGPCTSGKAALVFPSERSNLLSSANSKFSGFPEPRSLLLLISLLAQAGNKWSHLS